MSSFFIQNPKTKLVIDIKLGNPAKGSGLIANAQATTQLESSFQLWTFVTSNMQIGALTGYYFIQNQNATLAPPTSPQFVIDIELGGLTTKLPNKGVLLDAYPQKGPEQTTGQDFGEPSNANQLWGFMKDTSGYYYIVNPLTGFVIDISEGAKPLGTAGATLDGWPWKGSNVPGNVNQLWQFVPSGGNGAFVPDPPSVVRHLPPRP
jgi:hypothetical protein